MDVPFKNLNRINKFHEIHLRVIYNNKKSKFQKFLEKNKSVSINNRNLQVLATEVYKVTKELCPEVFVNDLMARTQPNYNFAIILVLKCLW